MALVLALAPLEGGFEIEKVHVCHDASALVRDTRGCQPDIIDNVIPYIADRGRKAETEPCKILGKFKDGKIVFADVKISAQCHPRERAGWTLGGSIHRSEAPPVPESSS